MHISCSRSRLTGLAKPRPSRRAASHEWVKSVASVSANPATAISSLVPPQLAAELKNCGPQRVRDAVVSSLLTVRKSREERGEEAISEGGTSDGKLWMHIVSG